MTWIKQIIIGITFGFSSVLYAQQYPLITNIDGRTTTSLDGKWQYIIDQYESGYYDYHLNLDNNGFFVNFNSNKIISVPGDWNTQQPELLYYEGTVWYRTQFNFQPKADKRVFLHFGAVNYEAVVWLNGKELGRHIGGYTPFNYEITKELKVGGNSLVLKIDNKRQKEGVPGLMFDWWNFGGITRPVHLIETPSTFIRDYSVQLKKGDPNCICGWIFLDGNQKEGPVRIEIPELKISKNIIANKEGRAVFEIKAKPEYWCPENPKLYTVNIISQTDRITEDIGFRTIETVETKLLLNGKEIFCRGANVHGQVGGHCAWSKEDATLLLSRAKELGCNFLRLVHYPHSEEMVQMAERMGIMLWEEIPVFWKLEWSNPDTYYNAENQLSDIISRDKNRANIIIWSLGNETPQSDERNQFFNRLATKARSLDD